MEVLLHQWDLSTFPGQVQSLVWTMPLGVTDEFEAPPLIVGNVMYVIYPQDAAGLRPNAVVALDLAQEGKIIWEFRPDVPDNLAIGLLFTAVSLTRSYALRRLFERLCAGAS